MSNQQDLTQMSDEQLKSALRSAQAAGSEVDRSTRVLFANQGPRVIIHRLEGNTITETWYRNGTGELLCDCIIRDAAGEYQKRYRKLEDALAWVRADAEMARIRAESKPQAS